MTHKPALHTTRERGEGEREDREQQDGSQTEL